MTAVSVAHLDTVIASQRVARMPPDDRLREAIHRAVQRKNGLLRRSLACRSLSYGGQVAPRNDG